MEVDRYIAIGLILIVAIVFSVSIFPHYDSMTIRRSEMEYSSSVTSTKDTFHGLEKMEMRKEKIGEIDNEISQVNSIPTRREIESFLKRNNIDMRSYNSVEYNCQDFSLDLAIDMLDNNISVYPISIKYKNISHMMLASNTTEGTIYIEPQTDSIFEKRYALKNFLLNEF